MSGRLPIQLLALMSLALGFAAYVRAPLAWDGAHHLFLITANRTTMIPEERHILALFQLPALLASRWVRDLDWITWIYSLSYCALPVAFVGFAFAVTRGSEVARRLRIWPLISLGLFGIWGQAYFISETQLLGMLAWPAFLHLLLDRSWRPFLWSVPLFFTHPGSAMFYVLFGVVSAIEPGRDAHRRHKVAAWWALALFQGMLAVSSPYSQRQTQYSVLWWSFKRSLWGWPLVGCIFALAFVALLVLERRSPRRALRIGLVAFAVLFGMSFVIWVPDLHSYLRSDYFRYFSVPFCILVMLACWIDHRLVGTKGESRFLPLIGGGFPVAVFCLGTVAMAIHWTRTSSAFRKSLDAAESNCIVASRISHGMLPFQESYLPAVSVLAQNNFSPRKVIVLDPLDCDASEFRKSVPFAPWDPRRSRNQSIGFWNFEKTGLPETAVHGARVAADSGSSGR